MLNKNKWLTGLLLCAVFNPVLAIEHVFNFDCSDMSDGAGGCDGRWDNTMTFPSGDTVKVNTGGTCSYAYVGGSFSPNPGAGGQSVNNTDFTLGSGQSGTLNVYAAGQGGYTWDFSPGGSLTHTNSVRPAGCAVNNAPVATYSSTINTDEDLGKGVTLTGTDADSDPLTYSLVSGASNGSANVASGGFFTYTPNNNYNGNDSFVYRVYDGTDYSANKTVNISVAAQPDPPSFSSSAVTSVLEDSSYSYSITATDPDAGDTPSISAPTKPAWLSFTDNGNGTASLTGSPTQTQVGGHSVSLRLNPGSENVAQNFTLTVVDVNDAPSFSASTPATVDEDAGTQTLNSWASFIASTGETESALSYTVSGISNAALFSANPAVNASGTLTYTLAANANGSSSFNLVVRDNSGTANSGVDTSATQNFTITVNPVNDAPTLDNSGNPTLTTILEDADPAGDLVSAVIASLGGTGISDVDSGSVEGIAVIAVDDSNGTWQFSTNAGSSWTDVGSVTPNAARLLTATANDKLRFVPAADFNGTVTAGLTFRAWDTTDSVASGTVGQDTSSNGGITVFSTATETLSISVTAVNDAPILTAVNPAAVDEDSGAQTIASWAAFNAGPTDESGQTLVTYAVSNMSNPSLFSTPPSVDNTGQLTYTPAPDANGTSTFDVTVQDDGGVANSGADTSTAQSVTITVNPVNDAPILDNSGDPTFTTILEDADPAGDLVSTVIASLGGAGITDVDSGAVEGMAVMAVDNTNGTWQFSTNAGSSWADVGSVAPNAARLLTATANDKLRFVPAADFNGSVTAGLTFRAWDASDSVVSGSAGQDTSSNGGISAFSTVTDTVSISVTAVNDQPSFEHLGDRTHPIEVSGAQTTAAWAFNLDMGAVDENTLQSPTFLVSVLTDVDDILSDTTPPTIAPNGTLTYTLNAGQGMAMLEVFLQDDGGVTDGGVDMSLAATFIISKGTLSLDLSTPNAGENEGDTVVTVTLSREHSVQDDLIVNLSSSDTSEAEVPATVVILDGQLSAQFAVTMIDDVYLDGPQDFTLTATHLNRSNGIATLTALDDERVLTVNMEGEGRVTGQTAGHDLRFSADAQQNLSTATTLMFAANSPAGIQSGSLLNLAHGDAIVTLGNNAQLSATPAAGWVFDTWGGICSDTGTLFVNNDYSCIAYFNQLSFTLSADVIGGEGAIIGSGDFLSNQTLTLQAQPSIGWTLPVTWSGDCAADGSVFLDDHKHCSATLTQALFHLSLNVVGEGSVTGAGDYLSFTSTAVNATAAPGWQFDGWDAHCANAAVLMDGDKTCVATFSRQLFTLSASVDGEGSVVGAGSYAFGDTAQLSALPAENGSFAGWSGDCASDGSVLMESDKQCVAQFNPPAVQSFNLSARVEGQGSVIGAGSYTAEVVAQLSTVADSGWGFVRWSGACATNGAVLMDADKECIAHFEALPPSENAQFAILLDGEGSVDGFSPPADGYPLGTSLLLQAVPAPEWFFLGWSGDCVGGLQDRRMGVLLDSDKTCTVHFTQDSVILTVEVMGTGRVDGDGAYPPGSDILLSAVRLNGWLFTGWGGDCSASGEVFLDRDKLCTATFEAPPDPDAPNPMENVPLDTFAVLTPETILTVPPIMLNQLSDEQLAAIPVAAFSQLSASQLANLGTDAVAGITPAQIASLPPEALSDLNSDSLQALATDTIAAFSPEQLNGLNAAEAVIMPSTEVSELMVNLNVQTINPLDVVKLLPENWGIDLRTGDLSAPSGTAITYQNLKTDNLLPEQVQVEAVPDLNSGFSLGGQGSKGSALNNMQTSLDTRPSVGTAEPPPTGFNLSQKGTGVLKVSATFDSQFELAFLPDPNNIIIVNGTMPIGLAVDEGGFTVIVTPSGEQFRVLPAPANPEALGQALGADSYTQVTADGSVFFDYTDSTRRRGRARQVSTFQAFVEPAPDAFICMAFCGAIPPEQLAPEFIPFPGQPAPEGCVCDPALFPADLQPGLNFPPPRRVNSGLPIGNQDKATFIYPDGRAQVINPALLEPDIFKQIGESYDGVDKVVRNANGTFSVTVANQKYLIRPQFDVQVLDNAERQDDASIELGNDQFEFHVPFEVQSADNRRRGRARQVVVFQPVIEFIPEEFCSFDWLPERRICQFGEQFCEEGFPGDWRCELSLEALR